MWSGVPVTPTPGWCLDSPDQAYNDECAASARAGLAETTFAAAYAEGRAMTLEQAIEYALGAETD